MLSPDSGNPGEFDITALLGELQKGNEQVAPQLIALVYDELRRIANRYMRRERVNHTLQATALVHEAYVKMVEQRAANWQNRAQFYGVAAQVMRRILIDHARTHTREKRGGGVTPISLDAALVFSPEHSSALIYLDGALQRLATMDARQAKIVEMRFFGGLTVEETAEALDISPKTVKRDWSVAKAWLHGELKSYDDHLTGTMGNG